MMTDYSSWKVADLKAELKNRGIPQTGLRLKQHFIERLVEEDAKAPAEEGATAPVESELQATSAPKLIAEEREKSDIVNAAPEPQEEQHEQSEESRQQDDLAPRRPETEPALDGGKSTGQNHEEGLHTGSHDPEKAQDAEGIQKAGAVPSEGTQEAPGETGEPPREDLRPAERSEPSVLEPSEANTELSTPLPIEEALEDKRKRKRRSQSPIPTAEAIAHKKARAKEQSPRVQLKDDEDSITQQQAPKDTTVEELKALDSGNQGRPAPTKQDARFRELFAPSETAPVQPLPPPEDIVMEDVGVEPALHPATASLYIDGLMRPLQPVALRKHLANLASAPGSSPKHDNVLQFYLDPIKTHCFVRFHDIAAASKVRSALHGAVWPNERNRKNLWVDFVPDQQIQDWIRTEEAARDRPGPPARWEVRYETTDDKTTVTLTEAGLNPRSAPSRPSGFNRTPPSGPRGSIAQAERRLSDVLPAPPPRPGQGFKPLDELFKSTTTKPKLYYLPVPRKVADKRLDQFDELLRKGTFPRRGGDEMRRITFEDDDYFVDVGPEYGPRALQRRQARGRGGRSTNAQR